MQTNPIQIEPPRLETTHVRLREINPGDHGFLYHLAVGTPQSFRWRFRSRQPSYEDFVGPLLHQGVYCHYIVESKNPRGAIGYAVCYRAETQNRHAYIALQGVPDLANSGLLMGAGYLLINLLFNYHHFDKLYAECPEFNMPMFRSSLGSDFQEEGRLRRHEYFLDRWWDLYLLAIYKSDRPTISKTQQLEVSGTDLHLDGFGRACSFETFRRVISGEFLLEDSEIDEDSILTEDLGFDSIMIFELVNIIESVSDHAIPDTEMTKLRTLGDAHILYVRSITNDL